MTRQAVAGKPHDQRSDSGPETGDAAPDANDATWPPGREGRGEQGQTERDDDRTPAPCKARNAPLAAIA